MGGIDDKNLKIRGFELTKKRQAMGWYSASLLVLVIGLFNAASRFPEGFDWFYTVASALASQKHNPEGSFWFSGALVGSMALLWRAISILEEASRSFASRNTKFSIAALRTGLICGVLVGLERLLFHHLSDEVHKAHEILALCAFLGLFWGILGLLIGAIQRRNINRWMLILVVSPLLAIGISQLWLYMDQRDLGWVRPNWRELGIPLYLSFAFWQWLAMAFLWIGLGTLLLTCGESTKKIPPR